MPLLMGLLKLYVMFRHNYIFGKEKNIFVKNLWVQLMSKSHHLLIAPIYRYPFMLWVWTAHQSPITFRVWITLWSPFTLQVWIAHQSPFTLWVWIALHSPFTLQVDYDATSAMFSTHIHHRVGKYLSGYQILTMDYT